MLSTKAKRKVATAIPATVSSVRVGRRARFLQT
jgi:hypothetical protein